LANIVSVIATAHGPFCYIPTEQWNVERAKRPIRSDVPFDSDEENERKGQRIHAGFAALRKQLAEAKPDVLVVFGNDQRELFDFTNYPALSIITGSELFGITLTDPTYASVGRTAVKGDPDLAVMLLSGLLERGFDPAFSLDLAPASHGVPHAIMNPLKSLTDFTIPVVPVVLNCYYTPQVSAMRSFQVGVAIRQILEADTTSRRVAVIGSGGLWHTSGEQNAYIDETFDNTLLNFMKAGDAEGMARHFDDYRVAGGDRSQRTAVKTTSNDLTQSVFESTGLPPSRGPQGGTRETCCWIAAAGVANGRPATIVDYVPVYSSPIGLGFAYWPLIQGD
jgi:aromatic ring-opening dioxygenase catalytic subunit (LigB family)